MKILHILEATQGGTRRHVLDLLPALAARGVACELIYSSRRYPAFTQDAQFLQARGIGVRDLTMARGCNPRLDAVALRELASHLKRSAPDVVHCHSTKAGALGRMAVLAAQSTLGRRIPLVYTPHCVAFDTALPHATRRVARWMEWLLAPLTSHFIAVSRHEARALHRVLRVKNTRLSVIYNGMDLQSFDILPHNSQLATQNFSVACFGRLSAQKNQRVLLAAWPRVCREVPGAHLTFVGGGEDQSTLEALSRTWNIADSVTFAGEIGEPRGLYRDFDLIVQPSRWEGCPYSILEAMAARCAIVAWDVGGLREVLGTSGENGILLPPSSPADLAAQIVSLARDAGRRQQLGHSARRRVETSFQLEPMVQKTLAVYGRVVNKNGQG